jgi:hypothetical protein
MTSTALYGGPVAVRRRDGEFVGTLLAEFWPERLPDDGPMWWGVRVSAFPDGFPLTSEEYLAEGADGRTWRIYVRTSFEPAEPGESVVKRAVKVIGLAEPSAAY